MVLDRAQATLRAAERVDARRSKEPLRDVVVVVAGCRTLGYGDPRLGVGQGTWDVVFTQTAVRFVDRTFVNRAFYETTVPYEDVTAIEVGGPGSTRTRGGFFGGGFGLQGAAEGVLIASALNLLTTRTRIDTILCIKTKTTELFLVNHDLTPDALGMHLSPVFTILRHREETTAEPGSLTKAPATAVDQLTKLAGLLDRGLIDEDEFRKLKREILTEDSGSSHT